MYFLYIKDIVLIFSLIQKQEKQSTGIIDVRRFIVVDSIGICLVCRPVPFK